MTSAPVAAQVAIEPPKTASQTSAEPSAPRAPGDSFAAALDRAGKSPDSSVKPDTAKAADITKDDHKTDATKSQTDSSANADDATDSIPQASANPASLPETSVPAVMAVITQLLPAPKAAEASPKSLNGSKPEMPGSTLAAIRPDPPPQTKFPPGVSAIGDPVLPRKHETAQSVDAVPTNKIVDGGLNAQSGKSGSQVPATATTGANDFVVVKPETTAQPVIGSVPSVNPDAATTVASADRSNPRPSSPAMGEALPRSTTAAEIIAAPVENAKAPDRSVAMGRSTTESSGNQVLVSDTTARAALGAGQDSPSGGSNERRSPSDAERGLLNLAANSSRAELTQQTGASDDPAPLNLTDRIRVVDQVAQRLDTMRLTTGRQEVTLHLRPDHLGDIRLTVITERDHIQAHIVAESAGVRQAVEEGRDRLRGALEQRGYTLQGLDVSLSQGNRQGFTAYTSQQSSQPISSTYAAPRAATDADSTAIASEPIAIRAARRGDGSLDYQA